MMLTNLRPRQSGSALIVTMLVIFLITIGISIALQQTTNTVRQTDASRDFSALRSAAEGSVDFAYGVWIKTTNNLFAAANASQLATGMTTVPTFVGITPAPSAEDGPLQIIPVDAFGKPSTTPVGTQINLDNFPGWVGQNYAYQASVRLQGKGPGGRTVKYGVKRAINYSVVPLFQATAFFEDNLELYKTAPMTIGGLVATNSEAYVSAPSDGVLTFTGNLSYAGNYHDNVHPPGAETWSGYTANSAFPPTYSNGGSDKQVTQVGRLEPLGADSALLLHPPKDPDTGVSTGDTNPNDDSMRELIEPPNTYVDPMTHKISTNATGTDPGPISDRRLFNKAGIRIRITGTSGSPVITITNHNGTTTLSNAQKTAIVNSMSQQTIYDRREGQNVDLTTLDIGKVRTTLNGAAGFNDILYIDDTRSTGLTDPKAIRLTNGTTLPNDGITIATQNALYIQGDYNTAAVRESSAVYADAVTILSNEWKDGDSADTLSKRNAKDTTVNTAIVAGFLPSGWKNPITGETYGYSGGLNNFPRFLEDWTDKKFTYTGSMIELFTSAIATGEWDTGAIYVPPNRIWNFDSNFVDTPPPGSLTAVSIGRGTLNRF